MKKSVTSPIIPYFICSILLSFLSIGDGKQNEGYDLDSDAPIRIGIKKRVNAKDCEWVYKRERSNKDQFSTRYLPPYFILQQAEWGCIIFNLFSFIFNLGLFTNADISFEKCENSNRRSNFSSLCWEFVQRWQRIWFLFCTVSLLVVF